MSADKLTIACGEAARRCEAALQSAGVPEADAALVTRSWLLAEMSSMPSHGLMRLKPTVERLRSGIVNPRPRIRREQTADNILCYDADGALGQIAGERAMKDCIRLALEKGSAFAAVRRAFHFGAIGFYTRMAADAGCLAFMCTNASPQMAAWGGMDKVLGTNPFALAFPTVKGDAFSLDVSTAAAARGKIRLAAREGRKIPPGWAMDSEGNDTTDAQAAMDGAVLPMAGHKGYGMAMAVDMLSAILTGADLSYEASNMFEGNRAVNTGCFISVLDLSRFVPAETYERRTAEWLERIRSSRLRPGADRIRIPGDTQNALKARCPEHIAVSRSTWEEILALSSVAQHPEDANEPNQNPL